MMSINATFMKTPSMKLILKLTLTLFLSCFCQAVFSVDVNNSEWDKKLQQADQLKSSRADKLSEILLQLEPQLDKFTHKQRYFYIYLSAYDKTYKGQINQAISLHQEVDENSQDTELSYRSKISLVNLYALQQKWLEGYVYLEKISLQRKEIKNLQIRHQGLMVSTVFYNEIEEYGMSIKLTQQLLDENVSGRNLCVTLSERVKARFALSNIDVLQKEIDEAINSCLIVNEKVIVNILRSYIASSYLDHNQPEKLIDLLEVHHQEMKDSPHNLLILKTDSLLAAAYLQTNNLDKAMENALAVIQHPDAAQYFKGVVRAYKVLAAIARQQGNNDLALEYQDKYISFKESFFAQNQAKQLAVASAKYQLSEKDNQILLLSKQEQISRLALKNQRQLIIVWSVALIAFFMLVFFWFYRKHAHRELLRQKQVNWELLELDKLKDRILTNTSHELRTPLNGIIGLSELILLDYEKNIEDELIEYIRLIGKCGTRLALIVSDILELAQLKSGRHKFYFEKFDFSELIHEANLLCSPLVDPKVSVSYQQDHQEIILVSDEQKVLQVIYNLLGNAIKFTHEGSINIRCELKDDFLWVYIKDTGIGIPEDKIESVFNGFEQVDNSNSRKYEGTGIGLAISREIIHGLGGKIYLKSQLGLGTEACFSLPVSPTTE